MHCSGIAKQVAHPNNKASVNHPFLKTYAASRINTTPFYRWGTWDFGAHSNRV